MSDDSKPTYEELIEVFDSITPEATAASIINMLSRLTEQEQLTLLAKMEETAKIIETWDHPSKPGYQTFEAKGTE